jgi:D-3-phosphoglycerate dehydrogenase
VITDEHSVDLAQHPLIRYARDHDNLIITPHIGGCTVESMAKTEVFMAKRLVEAIAQGIGCAAPAEAL